MCWFYSWISRQVIFRLLIAIAKRGNDKLGLLKVVQQNNTRFIQATIDGKATDYETVSKDKVWLKAISENHVYQFYFSTDGKDFKPAGEKFKVEGWLNWRGVEIGLFCWTDSEKSGYVDVDWFRYDYR